MTDPATPDDLAARPFDELVAELQRIVQALEAGNLPLEESIARYREALRLHAAAESRLREAELTISQLGRGLDVRQVRARPRQGEHAGQGRRPLHPLARQETWRGQLQPVAERGQDGGVVVRHGGG